MKDTARPKTAFYHHLAFALVTYMKYLVELDLACCTVPDKLRYFRSELAMVVYYSEDVEGCNLMVALAWAIDASGPTQSGQAVSKLCCQLDTFDREGRNAAQCGTAGLSGSVWGRRSRSSFVSAVAL